MSRKNPSIEEMAAEKGLTIKHCGNGHYQIKSKYLCVNYYPDSAKRTAYVNKTIGGKKHVSWEEAMQMALEQPNLPSNSSARKKTYAKAKANLYKRIKNCHWCGDPLDPKTMTLEHIVPLSIGGLDNFNNYTLACKDCNEMRGCNMPELQELEE